MQQQQAAPPPPRYTPAAIAELYTDVSKHLKDLNAHSNVSVRAVTLPSDEDIASLVRSRATFLPEKFPVSVVNPATALHLRGARDDLPRPNGGKRASAAFVLVAGKQRTVPAADLPSIKAFLRKHSIEMANTRLGLQQENARKDARSQSVVARKRRQAMIATATEAETRKKVVGKQALISELMRSTKFDMHDIFQMSCQFKELARDNGTISCDDFATIIGSHLGKLVGSVSHTAGSDDPAMAGTGVSSIGETISASNALVKRLYGVFDQDLNGSIDFREFIIGINSLVQGTLEQKLDALFKMYDKDGSGTISISELVLILNGGQEKMSQLAIYIDDYFAHVDTNGDAVISEEEFVQAASVEPLVLEALSKPLTFNRHTNFQLRQSLRCITERLKLDWSVILSILEDVNEATRQDREAAAQERMWLVKTNQADAAYEAPAAPLTSAQFHTIMFEYLHEPQAEDGHTLQDLFKAYTPSQAPADPKNRGKANCRDFIRDLAGMLRMLVVDTTHDEACSRFYFRFFDYDCDGQITRDELSSVVCSSFGTMGHELLETMKLLQGIDTNGDGELTKDEYLEAAKKNPLLLASIYICI